MKYQLIIARLNAKDGKAPGRILLFKKGWNEIEGEGRYLVDRQAYDAVVADIERRGNDLVFDYEHQTLLDMKAPAAGWIKLGLEWDEQLGIVAAVDWTEEAAGYIERDEYRYFSPVFFTRNSDKRLVALHSVALTNTPKHNHLTPILAKLGSDLKEEDLNMEFLKKLIAKLGLAETATEADVEAAIATLKDQTPEKVEVVAKEVVEALGLKPTDGVSTVVASIHALNQGNKNMVSREEFETLQGKLKGRDADDAVAQALADGKITPDQKEWATKYATDDLDGFNTFVSKAPAVVPVKPLPGRTDKADQVAADEATLTVSKMMDVDPEDIKKYGV